LILKIEEYFNSEQSQKIYEIAKEINNDYLYCFEEKMKSNDLEVLIDEIGESCHDFRTSIESNTMLVEARKILLKNFMRSIGTAI